MEVHDESIRINNSRVVQIILPTIIGNTYKVMVGVDSIDNINSGTIEVN